MQGNHGPQVLQKIETLIIKIGPFLRRYPKAERFTLAERTEKLLLDSIESIYWATYSKNDRLLKLKSARVQLQIATLLLRLARRQSFLSEGAYEDLALDMIEAGRMLSGWIKACEKLPNAKNLQQSL